MVLSICTGVCTAADRQVQPVGYTGSLISPSGSVFRSGQIIMEPYLSSNIVLGRFSGNGTTRWKSTGLASASTFNVIKVGLTNTLTLQLLPTASIYQRTGAKKLAIQRSDTPIELIWRFMTGHPDLRPDVSLFCGATLPIGQFEHLKSSGSATGVGASIGRVALTTQFLMTHIIDRELRLRAWVQYRTPLSHVSARGANAYALTDADVKLGAFGEFGLSSEVPVTRHFVLAVDLARDWANGDTLRLANGTITRTASTGAWSIAVGIEYNLSSGLGIIVGSGFTFAGHNEALTANPMAAVAFAL